MVDRPRPSFFLAAVLAACNATPRSPATGGAQLADAGGMADGGDLCPRAFAVVSSDYTSSNVSIIATDGQVRSESVISSGSAPAGLTAPLSGDVVLPLAAAPSGRLVLLDRYPNSVVTWVDPGTADVLGQLSVGTGFSANPHDYVELSSERAYVTRYENNPAPGAQPFDGGGDLLVIDPSRRVVTGRVPLGTDNDGPYLPRPDHLLLVGEEAWVVLQRFDADFTKAADARVVGVDVHTDRVTWTVDLHGLGSCGGLSRSPSGRAVALSCSVLTDADPLARSGIVVLSTESTPPRELSRHAVSRQLGAPVGSSVAFAAEDLLLGIAYGDANAKRNDAAFTLKLDTGEVTVLADAGEPFSLGDVVCTPGCGDRCLVADATTNTLRRWHVNGGGLAPEADVVVDPSVGLPPRALGPL